MNIICVDKLSKVYGEKDAQVKAVDEVSLTVEEGQFTAIVGSSGSGKSTLLHLIGGIIEPTSGTVELDGHDIFSLNDDRRSAFRRRKVGYVLQDYSLIPVLTAYENIVMPVVLDKQKPDKEYIKEIVELLGISDRLNHLPNQLSGGQQQRVAIGRALSNRPTVILADEPTGNLDKTNGHEVIKMLMECAKKYKQTLVVVTHDMAIAELADRVITISDGSIVNDQLKDSAVQVVM